MRIIEAIPKEIHFLTEITFAELQHLQTILDNMVFNYDGTTPAHVEAKQYLENQLYPTIAAAIKEMTNGH